MMRSRHGGEAAGEPAVGEHVTVLRAQLGSREAFASLFRHYQPRLLYYLRRLAPAGLDAEDVLQEVWLTVVRKVGSLEDPAAFKAWIYRIARNRAVSRLRRQRRTVPLDELTEEMEGEVPAASGSGEATIAGVDGRTLHQALEGLSAGHREVLTLRFVEDLTYEEIAQVVERSVGTVRSRLHYAKKALYAELSTRRL